MEKVRCIVALPVFTLLSMKWYCTDAANRKRAHEEESEGGPAVKKPAGESHGECLSYLQILYDV